MTNIYNRVRTTKCRERGFALVTALLLATLYFALMELLLIDSSRALAEAQRFRARIVALTMAESGVELAALRITTNPITVPVKRDLAQGTISGAYKPVSGGFVLTGHGASGGVISAEATVTIDGAIETPAPGTSTIRIDFATHSQ